MFYSIDDMRSAWCDIINEFNIELYKDVCVPHLFRQQRKFDLRSHRYGYLVGT